MRKIQDVLYHSFYSHPTKGLSMDNQARKKGFQIEKEELTLLYIYSDNYIRKNSRESNKILELIKFIFKMSLLKWSIIMIYTSFVFLTTNEKSKH